MLKYLIGFKAHLLGILAVFGAIFAVYAKGRTDELKRTKKKLEKEYDETKDKVQGVVMSKSREAALKRLKEKLDG